MANTLDPMDLKQIITLHLDGYSNWACPDGYHASFEHTNLQPRAIEHQCPTKADHKCPNDPGRVSSPG